MDHAKTGEIVKAHYKSGSYVGEVVEDRGENYLVKVLAVLKHPMQGDLHNPGKTENVFFHQRKALSYQEKMNVAKPAVHTYEGEVPDYKASLKDAMNALETKLDRKDTEFNQKAKRTMTDLKDQYFK